MINNNDYNETFNLTPQFGDSMMIDELEFALDSMPLDKLAVVFVDQQ